MLPLKFAVFTETWVGRLIFSPFILLLTCTGIIT